MGWDGMGWDGLKRESWDWKAAKSNLQSLVDMENWRLVSAWLSVRFML